MPQGRAGTRYILVALDTYTKFVQLYPIKRADTKTTINKIFNHNIPNFGKPNRIQSDNGSQFTAKNWAKRLKQENIIAVFSSVRHPQGNMVERIMRELGNFFRVLVREKHQSWSIWVNFTQNVLNETFHSTIGFAPSEVHLGIQPSRFWSNWIDKPPDLETTLESKLELALNNMMKNREKWRTNANKYLVPVLYDINDCVLIKQCNMYDAASAVTGKFMSIFAGPFKIAKVIKDCTYVLNFQDGKRRGIFQGSLLRPYFQEVDSSRPAESKESTSEGEVGESAEARSGEAAVAGTAALGSDGAGS